MTAGLVPPADPLALYDSLSPDQQAALDTTAAGTAEIVPRYGRQRGRELA